MTSLRNFDEDNGKSQKNIDHIKQGLNYINSITREHLSNEAKDFGNQLINKYEELASEVNLQRSTNLGLHMEIANLIKDKNSLRHDIKVLFEHVKKLEVLLGVKRDPKFENAMNQVPSTY